MPVLATPSPAYAAAAPSTFLALPDEMHIEIAKKLEARDAARMRLVCKQCYAVWSADGAPILPLRCAVMCSAAGRS